MKNWSFRKWFVIYAVGVLLMAYATFVPMDMIQPKQVAVFLIATLFASSSLWHLYQLNQMKKGEKKNNKKED